MTEKPFRESVGRRVRRTALGAVLLAAAAGAGGMPAGAAELPEAARRAVVAAALKSTVPPALALAVARGGAIAAPRARGLPEEAVGVMGVRPSLARAELGVGASVLRELRANAGLGVALLERLYRRHGGRWDLALSHYRGGPLGRCESGPVVHDDTLDYVAEIMEWWRRYQEDGAVAASAEERHDAEAFPARPAARPEGARAASPAGAARFRSDDRPLHGASMAGRFH